MKKTLEERCKAVRGMTIHCIATGGEEFEGLVAEIVPHKGITIDYLDPEPMKRLGYGAVHACCHNVENPSIEWGTPEEFEAEFEYTLASIEAGLWDGTKFRDSTEAKQGGGGMTSCAF